jgi:hypothetical protein
MFSIFLHRKRYEVIKHDRTQNALAHDWRNQSSWNKFEHAAKVITYALVYINEVLHYQFVHEKISTLTFETHHVTSQNTQNLKLRLHLKLFSYLFVCLAEQLALQDIWFIFRDIGSWNRQPQKAEMHKFSKNLRKCENSMRYNVDIKEFPYWKPTIFSCHRI